MTRYMNRLAIALAGAVVCVAAHGALAQQITGAGATFPAPVYLKWGEQAKAAIGIELNYQAIGSGAGQNQILNRTVDFGASDAPMAEAKLSSGNLLQFPTVIGAVVPIVNLPGIKPNQLKLTGELLADIYLGKIKRWNDPSLVEMNRGIKLPSALIAPVYRADGSGTTFVFTSYLHAAAPQWPQTKVGTSVKWEAGNGAKGNDGVAATVRQVRGGIGYVEYAYAAQNNLTTAMLRNHSGHFVSPTSETFDAAAGNGDWGGVPNFAVSLVDTNGETSWPIVSTTFILLPKDPKSPDRAALVMKFFDWAYKNGGEAASSLHYIMLPAAVQDAVRGKWRTEIKGPDGKPLYQ